MIAKVWKLVSLGHTSAVGLKHVMRDMRFWAENLIFFAQQHDYESMNQKGSIDWEWLPSLVIFI